MSEDYSNTPSPMEDRIDYEAQPYEDTELPYVEASSTSSSGQSTSSSVQQPARPTEEARLAAAYQLGDVLKRYESESAAFTTDNLPSAALAVSAIFISIGMFMMWGLTWPIILFCMLIFTPWLSTVIGRLPREIMAALQDTKLYLCTNGLMIIKWGRVQALRWEQMRAIQYCREQNVLRSYYILYLDEGKPVTLDRFLVGTKLWELGEIIEREISQRLLPDAIAAYEAGQELDFGAINVTAQGLRLKEEPQSLAWERFAAVDYHQGYYLTIRAMQEEGITSIWQKIEVERMLNLCVFLPLVAHIKSSLRASAHHSEGAHIHSQGEGTELGHETNPRFQEQHSAQEEELERMRRVYEETFERLRSRREVTPIPEEVVEALGVLGVSAESSFDMIRHQYRQLAKRSHPDAGGDPETFKRINAAYECVVAWITSHR